MNPAKRCTRTYLSMSVDACTLHMRVYEKVTVTIIRSVRKETRSNQNFRIIFWEFCGCAISRDSRERFAREKERMRRSFPSRASKRSMRIIHDSLTSIETRETQRSTTSTIKDIPRQIREINISTE